MPSKCLAYHHGIRLAGANADQHPPGPRGSGSPTGSRSTRFASSPHETREGNRPSGRAFRIPFTEIVAVEALQLNQPYATGYPPASDSLIRFLEHVGRVERRDSITVSVRPTHRGPQCVVGEGDCRDASAGKAKPPDQAVLGNGPRASDPTLILEEWSDAVPIESEKPTLRIKSNGLRNGAKGFEPLPTWV
jgi:hypothetical protein